MFTVIGRMMETHNEFKIVNGIIEFVAVAMMDEFIVGERTTQEIFHDKSMLIDSFTISPQDLIPRFCKIISDFTISPFFAKVNVSISLEAEQMHIAKSMSSYSKRTPINLANIGLNMFGEFSGYRVFNHPMHYLSSLITKMPQMQTVVKRNIRANWVKSVNPKSSKGYGNTEPSRGYIPGRCNDYRRGLVPLITGMSARPERDEIV
jgi:hypothetical protein